MNPTPVLALSEGASQWFYVGFLLALYAFVSGILVLLGKHGEETDPLRVVVRRMSYALEVGTGYPGWAMAGVLSALVMLGMAALGLYWDVAWHVDFGRDEVLFTPPHTMIVVGLGGLIWAAGVAVVFATIDRVRTGFRFAGLQVPWSALSLGSLGLGGLIAFPFDNLWHAAYGIDVTLWSPSHLMLVGGGALATIAAWLMIAEARPEASPKWLGTFIQIVVAGAILVGLTSFQGEFDFGVPQFQALYWPLLVVAAAGFVLVTARIALGPGGALATAVTFVVLRGIFALVVAGALNHTVPRFPLYLVAAVVVEVAALALGTARSLRFAAVAAIGVASVGLAAEVTFAELSGWFETSSSLLPPAALLAPVAAVAAAVLGAGLARAYSAPAVPGAILAAAGIALVVVMAVPLPRDVGEVDAVIRLTAVGDRAIVDVALSPADAAVGATAFGVVSWQGGGRVSASLEPLGEGRYRSSKPLPITGSWKTMVGLFRGSEVMAAPVYLPADALSGAAAIPPLPERQASFVRNTELFLRETRPGPAWPAFVAYGGVGITTAVWVGLFVLAIRRLVVSSTASDRTTPAAGSAAAPGGLIAWPLAGAGGSAFSRTTDPGRR